MKLIRSLAGLFLFLALLASASLAQGAQRTFVSGLGSDSNPCSRTAPCRTFSQAISQTNAGGEVVVLDSAGYGAFSIAKSISIISPPGIYAGISVFTGDGISINAGASDVVVLRGLTINGQGGNNGVAFRAGGTLRVEACAIKGLLVTSGPPNRGVLIAGGNILVRDTVISDCDLGISFQGAGSLDVKDIVVSDCKFRGISVAGASSGTVQAAMDHITVERCLEAISIGMIGSTTFVGAIRDSTVAGSGFGINVEAGTGASAFIDVERCLVANGGTGLMTQQPGGNSAMSISNCLVSHNALGFDTTFGGTILTRGNNSFVGNGSNSSTLTPFNPQ